MESRTLSGVAGAGAWAIRMAPRFFERYREESRRAVAPAPARPNPAAWPDSGVHAAWLGHATVLLQIDGFTILTDPVFSLRAGLRVGPLTLGVKRLVAPALEIPALPKLDMVLLSHCHFDHFDIPSLRHLESRGTTVVAPARTSDLLRVRRWGNVKEVGWGELTRVGPVEIGAFRVNHWGARMRSDTYRGYNGYTIEAGRYRVLFGGDTAYTPAFALLKTPRPFDLALMPIGAYDPWIHYHCTPEQALSMANDAGAGRILPIHHQTFALSREPYLEPIERMLEAAGSDPGRVVMDRIGQEWHL
ncbi:MAG: MBL fold metallo-hydrolase [Bryobacteraceae bacterium]